MSEKMRERVARAVCAERLKWGWTGPGKKVRAIDEMLAAAAIAATREPTEDVINAMIAALGSDSERPTALVVLDIWLAANDAMLADKQN